MEEKKDTDYFSLIPFLGSFIIFIGVTRLIVYYSFFGVNIVGFLDLEEILTSFLDILLVVVLILIISIIQDFLLRSKKGHERKQAERDKIMREPVFIKRLKKYFTYHSALFYVCLLVFLFFGVRSFFDTHITYHTLVLIAGFYLICMLFIVLIFEVDIRHQRMHSSALTRRFYALVILSVFFLCVVIVMSRNEAERVSQNKTFHGTSIRFDNDSLFVSDSLNYYIGKTKNYLFVHHQNEKITDAIPMERVKQISYKKKK